MKHGAYGGKMYSTKGGGSKRATIKSPVVSNKRKV